MILVTGARGVVGHVLTARLKANKHAFKTVSRSSEAAIKWDLSSPLNDEVVEQLKGIDCLFHCAPIWLLSPHIEALKGCGLRRVVVFSSTSVISKKKSLNPQEQALVQQLGDAEQALREYCEKGDIALTILRPSMIYGYGRDQNVSHIASFIRRFGFMLLVGRAQGLRQPVHADDLVTALLRVQNAEQTYAQTYNLAGAETLSYRQMVERIFIGLGKKPVIIRLPLFLFRFALKLAGMIRRGTYTPDMADRMNQNLNYDNNPAINDFGYQAQPFLSKPERDLVSKLVSK